MEIFTQAFNKAIKDKLNKSLHPLDNNILENLNEDTILNITSDLAKSLKQTLLNDSSKMLEERRELFFDFYQNNHNRWQSAFDLFETFIVICTEAGENFNSFYRPTAAKENDLVFDLLVRHHARACHIAQEILCLLKSGFADAAHARWRALHEVTATAMFIEKHGIECAERFYWHDVIESYKGMSQYKKYEDRLNAESPTDEEIFDCKESYDELITKYGKNFKDSYGWASNIFPNKRVTFADIEQDVGLDHMRPYYKWASQNIHAGAKGINTKLGLCEAKEDILLVGHSNSGMTDPAHATAIALSQITVCLLTLNPNIDSLVISKIISELETEIGNEFLKCDRSTKCEYIKNR